MPILSWCVNVIVCVRLKLMVSIVPYFKKSSPLVGSYLKKQFPKVSVKIISRHNLQLR